MSFDIAFTATVGTEGGYSDNPNDRGGKTRFGITEDVARANGYQGDMRELPFAKAKAIYRARYWDALNLDAIDSRSVDISSALFDTAVNSGTGTAGRYLQIALNAFNRQQKDYPDIPVDGDIGSKTLKVYDAFLDLRGRNGVTVLRRALNAQKGARYLQLAKVREQDEDFEFGWFLKRVGG